MSEVHARLTWDDVGSRYYHTGVKNGVLYVRNAQGAYPKGVAWNGLTAVNASPDGAEPTDLWADNFKYASFRAAETFGGSINAYTWPDEWYECDGYAEAAPGMFIGQQARSVFGLCYRSEVGNDVLAADMPGAPYILHLVYGATASPSERENATINDNPDAVEFSWDFETTPVTVGNAIVNGRPTSYIELDSRKVPEAKMTAIEAILYGSNTADARLPLPAEIAQLLNQQ